MIRRPKINVPVAVGLAGLGLALITGSDPSLAGETDIPAILAEKGRVECQPAIPFFCRNIHVSCSGQSTIRTQPFELIVTGERGMLVYDMGKPAGPDSGPVRIADDYALLRLRPDADYVRVEADGRYSFRIYLKGIALMSHGTCS